MAEDPILRTPRLILRAPRLEDAGDLHEVFGDAGTMRYWSTAPDPDLAATRTRIEKMTQTSPPRTYFVIERDGRAIGTGGVHNGAEIGFILHRDHWRGGLMREAVTAMIPYLFDVLDTDRLTADADPQNAASVGFLRALGFTETGRAENTFCINGQWSDSVYFALPRPG